MEVLIGHGVCHAIIETSAILDERDIVDAIFRIAGDVQTDIVVVPQDARRRNAGDGVPYVFTKIRKRIRRGDS